MSCGVVVRLNHSVRYAMPGTTNIPGEWKAHGVTNRGVKSSQALHFWSVDLGQAANLNFDFLVHDMGIV